MKRRLIIVLLGVATVGFFVWVHQQSPAALSLEKLQSHRDQLLDLYAQHPLLFAFTYVAAYAFFAALPTLGITVLTLAAGFLFGTWLGTLLVSIASTAGATLTFLVSRYFLRSQTKRWFPDSTERLRLAFRDNDPLYLIALRMVTIFPFFLVNVSLGLTSLRLWTFCWASQLGMLPVTFAYVWAGTQLSDVRSSQDLLSPAIWIAFAVMGLLPIALRGFVRLWRSPRCDYNVVVIGGGSAGLVTAYIAAALKARVALIEKNKMGGDCLNTGCVPSKALIRAANWLKERESGEQLGFLQGVPSLSKREFARSNFKTIMASVHRVIAEIAPHDSIQRYTELGVECIQGSAKIEDAHTVNVEGRRLSSQNIVIATGAQPFVPEIPGLKEVGYLTSETLWELQSYPERLLVLGGGAIGCELAQAFARLGCEVTLIDRSNRILSKEEPEASAEVAQSLLDDGVKLLLQAEVVQFQTRENQKVAICQRGADRSEIQFDQVLVAVGRRPRLNGLGLDSLGLQANDLDKPLKADSFMRLPGFENIFLCGDVAGLHQFTHTASHQAWYASVNALFRPFKQFRIDNRVIPWCTFTDPEVAHVGLYESEARTSGICYQVTRYDLNDLDRAITDRTARGFVKVITRSNSDEILGVTIVGTHAGETIAEFVTAMKFKLGLNKILSTIHSYPTFAEANKYVAGVWRRTNSPLRILLWLGRFHRWRRAGIRG